MEQHSSRNDSRYSQSMNLSKHKLVFLGDQGVGKTSIINRFIFDVFDEKSAVPYLLSPPSASTSSARP